MAGLMGSIGVGEVDDVASLGGDPASFGDDTATLGEDGASTGDDDKLGAGGELANAGSASEPTNPASTISFPASRVRSTTAGCLAGAGRGTVGELMVRKNGSMYNGRSLC